jgi:hypothetical protein
MAERGGRAGLALGACSGLSLARDDLQSDVQAGLLVAREPDLTHAAGAQRPKRAVPSQDQLTLGSGE